MGFSKFKAGSSPANLPPLLQALYGWKPPRPPVEEEDPFADLKTCPVISYCEATLLQLPWAVLETSRSRRPQRLHFEVDGELPQGHFDRSWTVSPGARGLPGPFEREVFRALEWMALEKFFAHGRRFENPLLFQIPEICERLCLKELSTHYRAIDRSIRLLSELEIERSSLSPWTRAREIPALSQRVKLIERLAFDPRPGPHRRPAFRKHALFFGRYFVDSINSGRIRAMNWGLWISLRRPLSRRLLEVLDFAAAPAGTRRSLTLPMSRLARLLPVRGSLDRGRLRVLLDQAHEELLAKKHFESVEWTASLEPIVTYQPGVAQLSIARLLRRQGMPVPPFRAVSPGCLGSA